MFDYYVLINFICFACMVRDKIYAVKNWPRTPEMHLMAIAVLGGAIGGALAMVVCFHKIRKSLFIIGFPLCTAFHFGFPVSLVVFFAILLRSGR